jgi:hypothetical protein
MFHEDLVDKSYILQAPLLIGCDIRSATSEALEILSNNEVINVNQGHLYKILWKRIFQYEFQSLFS